MVLLWGRMKSLTGEARATLPPSAFLRLQTFGCLLRGNTGNKSIVNKCSSGTKDGACDRDAWVTAVGWAGRLRHAAPVVLALLLSGHSKTGRWASAVPCEWHHRSHSPWWPVAFPQGVVLSQGNIRPRKPHVTLSAAGSTIVEG